MKPNALIQSAGLVQNAARTLFLSGILYQDVHGFTAREIADDLGVDPGDWSEAAWPVRVVVRPREPGGFVRLPFRGHAEPERGRSGLPSDFTSHRENDWCSARSYQCGGHAGTASCGAHLR